MSKERVSPQSGFSLIELLTVVAVIGIIAAVAAGNFFSTRQAAQAASAVSALRLIHSAQYSHRTNVGVFGDRAALAAGGYLNDPFLAAGAKNDYSFAIAPDAGAPTINYAANAAPLSHPTVMRHYFCDATGVIRSEHGAAATETSEPIN